MTRALALAVGVLAAAGCSRGIAEIEAHEIEPRGPAAVPTVHVTWLGTAGVRLDDGWTTIVVDPFVSRPGLGEIVFGHPLEPDPVRLEALVRTDDVAAVLVSHSHYDHLMDAPWVADRAGADLVGSPSTIAVGRAWGLPAGQLVDVEPGRTLRYGDFQITFIESRHGKVLAGRVPMPGEIEHPQLPMRGTSYRMGGAHGIVIEHPAGTIVHHASAAWVEGMYDGVDADVVMLGLAGHRDLPSYLRHVVDATGATRVIPIHWDDFFRPIEEPLRPLGAADVPEFFETIESSRPDLQVETLPPLEERVVLGGGLPTPTGKGRHRSPAPG